MSKDTFEYHRGKHHRAYVDNLNKQIDGTERDDMSLDDVVLVTYNKGVPLPAFNNAVLFSYAYKFTFLESYIFVFLSVVLFFMFF
jgi:Fe-Mn family superoxide dismutase